jgi:hypothetical protein
MPISAGLAGLSRLPGLPRLARGAAGTGCAAGAALAGHPARPGCAALATCAAVAAAASVAAGPTFTAGPAFATCAAVAVVTRRAVAAVAVRIVGCEASTTGMHDGYAADGVAARGRSGAQKGQCRKQSHAGSRIPAYDVNDLVRSAISCVTAVMSHWSTSL